MSDPIAGNAGVFVVKSNGTTALSSTGMSVEQIQDNMKQIAATTAKQRRQRRV